MKKLYIFIFILLAALLFVSQGCLRRGEVQVGTSFVGGIEGLNIMFREDEPPQSILDDANEEFFISVEDKKNNGPDNCYRDSNKHYRDKICFVFGLMREKERVLGQAVFEKIVEDNTHGSRVDNDKRRDERQENPHNKLGWINFLPRCWYPLSVTILPCGVRTRNPI